METENQDSPKKEGTIIRDWLNSAILEIKDDLNRRFPGKYDDEQLDRLIRNKIRSVLLEDEEED